MRLIAILVVIYIPFAFIYKLQAELTNEWRNYYWLFSSIFYAVVFFKIQTFHKLDYFKAKYHKQDLKMYRVIILLFAIYMGVIFALRIYVAFNIHLYKVLIDSVGEYTLGSFALIVFVTIITLMRWWQK